MRSSRPRASENYEVPKFVVMESQRHALAKRKHSTTSAAENFSASNTSEQSLAINLISTDSDQETFCASQSTFGDSHSTSAANHSKSDGNRSKSAANRSRSDSNRSKSDASLSKSDGNRSKSDVSLSKSDGNRSRSDGNHSKSDASHLKRHDLMEDSMEQSAISGDCNHSNSNFSAESFVNLTQAESMNLRAVISADQYLERINIEQQIRTKTKDLDTVLAIEGLQGVRIREVLNICFSLLPQIPALKPTMEIALFMGTAFQYSSVAGNKWNADVVAHMFYLLGNMAGWHLCQKGANHFRSVASLVYTTINGSNGLPKDDFLEVASSLSYPTELKMTSGNHKHLVFSPPRITFRI